MNWKPSKRQALLKKRLIDSSQVYWQTSHQLNQMLLKMLHHDDVYTPDDLYYKYISNHRSELQSRKIRPIKAAGHPLQISSSRQIDQALVNLNSALTQLKDVIDKCHVK